MAKVSPIIFHVPHASPYPPDAYRLNRKWCAEGREEVCEGGPLVITGGDIKELTLCNVYDEPVTRIEVPDTGKLIIELKRD